MLFKATVKGLSPECFYWVAEGEGGFSFQKLKMFIVRAVLPLWPSAEVKVNFPHPCLLFEGGQGVVGMLH